MRMYEYPSITWGYMGKSPDMTIKIVEIIQKMGSQILPASIWYKMM